MVQIATRNSPCLRVLIILIINLLCSVEMPLAAQTATAGGIINRYAAVINYDSCVGRINVLDTTGFRPGTQVLIMQMQGASISTSNSFLYGIVTNMNFAGRYERAEVIGVAAGAVFLKNRPVYSLFLDGHVQLVTIPQYQDLIVTDTIKPFAWDGSIGGVVALEVSGTLTLNAPIWADGAGFRGGQPYVAPNNNCTWVVPEIGYVYGIPNWRGGRKGEGIAEVTAGFELGRGPQSTGGGGGNDHNAGGGGGGNTADGGDGGDNDEPSVFGCDGYYPGLGGNAPNSIQNRMFLGGGGGAGHANNIVAGAGGRGGGIVYLRANNINGINPKVTANGQSALNADGDGAGGGGAGGTIWLDVITATSGLIVRANGGAGGNTLNQNAARCFGPGGGGAGGRLLTNATGVSLQVQGGLAGRITQSSNGCNNSTSGAENGNSGAIQALPIMQQGTVNTQLPMLTLPPTAAVVCPGDTATFTIAYTGGATAIQWQISTDDGTTWQPIPGANDSIWVVPNVAATQDGHQYRCMLEVENCFYQTTSAAAPLIVAGAPIVDFGVSQQTYNVFNFNDLTLGNNGPISWNFGDGSGSTALAPTHTYTSEDTFLVTMTIQTTCGPRTVSKQVVVLFPPSAGFVAPDSILVCTSGTVTFQNTTTGTGTSYQWLFSAGSPALSNDLNPVVTFTSSGLVTVTLIATNAASSDTLIQTLQVYQPAPVSITYTATTLPDGSVQFSPTVSGSGQYLWDFGDGTTSTESNPTHTYATPNSYDTQVQYFGLCDTVISTLTVLAIAPPQAAFFVPDTIFGCGSTQVLFADNSTVDQGTYLWMFGGGSQSTSNEQNPIITYTNTGSYTATLTLSNPAGTSTATRDFVVVLTPLPVAAFVVDDLDMSNEVQFEYTGTTMQSISWDFGDPASGVNNTSTALNPMHVYLGGDGFYTVTLRVENICGVSILQQQIEVNADGVRTSNPVLQAQVQVFPNPARDYITIRATRLGVNTSATAIFYDASGRLMTTQTVADNELTCPVSDWPAGLYFLTLKWPDSAQVLGLRVLVGR
jgi:PKD repeat protein